VTDFFRAVVEYEFMRNALFAGLLASLACGVMGSFVVARRITYVAGGIAHSVLGGMGIAGFLIAVYHWSWLTPLHGAIMAALVSALVIGWVTLRARQREDTIIGAVWAVGMAVGILFISRTPGYNQELMSYLFGNILMVSGDDLLTLLRLDIIIVIPTLFLYHRFLAVCFDAEFARVRGVRVDVYYIVLLCLTALTVVSLVTVVGVVLVIALLTLPPAVAGCCTRTFRGMMIGAVVFCALFTVSGLAISYATNFPSGATIVLVAGLCYVIILTARWLWRRNRNAVTQPSQST